jgi:hypothetical protein
MSAKATTRGTGTVVVASPASLDRTDHSYRDGSGNRINLCVGDVLRMSGIVQPYPDAAQRFVEHARNLGETVHDWCDYLDRDGFIVEELRDTEILPYVLAYSRFREECSPCWDSIEESVSALGCAGTPDRIGNIRVKGIHEVLIDIKTPRKAEAHWGIQLSAYQILTGRSECALYALLLSSDATYKLIPYKSEPEVFLAALTVAKWKLANNKNK